MFTAQTEDCGITNLQTTRRDAATKMSLMGVTSTICQYFFHWTGIVAESGNCQ